MITDLDVQVVPRQYVDQDCNYNSAERNGDEDNDPGRPALGTDFAVPHVAQPRLAVGATSAL